MGFSLWVMKTSPVGNPRLSLIQAIYSLANFLHPYPSLPPRSTPQLLLLLDTVLPNSRPVSSSVTLTKLVPFLASTMRRENLFYQVRKVRLVHHYLLYLMCHAGSNPASVTTSESTEQEAGPSSCSAIIPKSWDHIRISEDPSPPKWLHQNYPVSHFISVANLLKRVECPPPLSNRSPQFLPSVLLDILHKS